MSLKRITYSSAKKNIPINQLRKYLRYLGDCNNKDEGLMTVQETCKFWVEVIYIAPKQSILTRDESRLMELELLSYMRGYAFPKITTIHTS